ncbi:hypothetical protein ACM26V_01930 [Salipaludibacillus sp. HK11]|uniref:hypothetical protein n=1 Tax=Salipaludibacillus sp. HK11 TaxID=3394320 RepID=UPI0039FD9F98
MTKQTFKYAHRMMYSLVIAVGCVFIYISTDYLSSYFFSNSHHLFSMNALFYMLLSYWVIIFFVSLLFEQFLLSIRAKTISLFFYFFFLTGAIQGLVHYVMQTEVLFESLLITSIFVSITSAALIIKGFQKSSSETKPYFQQIYRFFNQRHPFDWAVRILAGGILLFITYYLMSSMIFPFIEPYYNQKSFHFGLYFESKKRMAMVTHSVLMILGFIPIFALWRGSKSSLLFWLGFPLFIVVALQPFILYIHWPLGFRFPIFIQTTMIIYIQTIILVQLLFIPTTGNEEDRFSKFLWSNNKSFEREYYSGIKE